MFQYAACAGKIPVTLKHDEISDEFLINQSQLGIEYVNIEDMKFEIDRLMKDDFYRKYKESLLKHSIISRDAFEAQIDKMLKAHVTDHKICFRNIDTSSTQREYLENFRIKKLGQSTVTKSNLILLKYIPMMYLIGVLWKLNIKLYNYFKIKFTKN